MEQPLGGINERIELWESLVEESRLDEVYKTRLRELLGKAKDADFDTDKSRDDWVYFTVHQIADITNEAAKNGADESITKALFENLREDVWSFWKELRS